MLCYQCYMFGHTRQRCTQKEETCGHCGQMHDVVRGTRCENPAYCTRCKSTDHSVGSRSCPEYRREDTIQHIRVDNNLPYPEARRLYERQNGQRTFAGVANASKDATIADWTAKCHSMANQLAAKDARIKEMEEGQCTTTPAARNEDFMALKKLVETLQADVAAKNQRIRILEMANSTNARMGLAQKHGTIEDLVGRLSALEAAMTRKDDEIIELRKQNEAYRKLLGSKALKAHQKVALKEKASSPTGTAMKLPGGKQPKPAPGSTTTNPTTSQETPMITETTPTTTTTPENTQETPKYTGTKPKRKKTKENANSQMDISDHEGNACGASIQASLVVDISSDERDGTEEEKP